uniref:G-protein coupled receptors family 1 profile domain-containing protein n=1 Tax=Panagrolaimus sp. PS1159 TaxID=55785 RepID=A0AC35GZ45_9BILA
MTSTTFDDDTIIDFVKTASRVAFASAAAIGIPGNLFVLFAIIYSRDLRTVSNIFIFNLALADLLFLMGVPILIIQSIKGEWIFGPIVCKLYLASSGVNQFASATFMGVLSFDRYLAVCHAVSSTRIRTKKFAAVLVLISWIIVIIEVAPLIKFSKVVERPNRYNKTTASCTIYWGDMDKFDDQVVKIRRIFTTYSFTFSYLIPLIGVWYFYSKIIILVWLRRSRFWANRHRLRRQTTKILLYKKYFGETQTHLEQALIQAENIEILKVLFIHPFH